MKKLILKLVIAIICLGLISVNCKKSNLVPVQGQPNQSNPFQSEAVVTGYDLAPCYTVECGGVKVIIQNDTAKNPPPFYLVYSGLEQYGISQNTQFPVNVSIDWKHDTSSLRASNYILVTRLKTDN